MALQDVTNKEKGSSYTTSVALHSRFAPIVKKGIRVHQQLPKSEFPAFRASGATNMDLWLDGNLYPPDPVTRKPPQFQTLKTYIEFLCHGESGFFGYTNHLVSTSDVVKGLEQELDKTRADCLRENVVLQNSIAKHVADLDAVNSSWADREKDLLAARREEIVKFESELESLKARCTTLEQELERTELSYKSNLEILEQEHREATDQHKQQLESKMLQAAEELARVHEVHCEELACGKQELAEVRKALWKLKKKMERMVSTPLGAQLRASKGLSELSKTGGAARARVAKIRSLLHPRIVQSIQDGTKSGGGKKRLCGDRDIQEGTGDAIGRLLSQGETLALVSNPSNSFVATEIANYYLDKIGKDLGTEAILAACDMTGVSQKGYGEIYKTIKGRVQLVDKRLKPTFLPNPHKVKLLRSELNSKLKDLVGDYYHIDSTLETVVQVLVTNAKGRKKKSEITRVVLTSKNNLFVDIEVVQWTMVKLYGFTTEEVGDHPLVFVLKMDEAEIVHGRKFERVSLTLMNRALDPSILKTDDRYFSVQFETEIWPIACFEVAKESHEVLQWVFEQTQFSTLIMAQDGGQLLCVDGVGNFKVQWHLSADMKTIKCLYGLKHGANATHSCIYCNQERTKPVVGTSASTTSEARRRKHTWHGGLFAGNVLSKPVSIEEESRWKPILPIPLERVHICTLYALTRIMEKILHLHFMFIWNMENEARQQVAIQNMERTLSAAGLHGGNVRIMKDTVLSGASNSVLVKPSLNGVTAGRMFQPSTWSGQDRVWKDILRSENNTLNQGRQYLERVEMWKALETVYPYLVGLSLDQEQIDTFKGKIETWGRLYVKCFGEDHVTHYMHNLVRYGPWYVQTYGSLAVWNNQGMEKSHHAAKAANQHHTQHGGTKDRTSAIVQQYQHWYRNIQHRFAKKVDLLESRNIKTVHSDPTMAAKLQKKRTAYTTSNRLDAARRWRENRTQKGRAWVTIGAEEGVQDNDMNSL